MMFHRKSSIIWLSLFLIMMVGCSNEKYEETAAGKEFKEQYNDYYLDVETIDGDELVSITNYEPIKGFHIKNLFNRKSYIEDISFGYDDDYAQYVYTIFVSEGKDILNVTLDSEMKEQLLTEGDWQPKEDLEKFIKNKLQMMSEAIQILEENDER